MRKLMVLLMFLTTVIAGYGVMQLTIKVNHASDDRSYPYRALATTEAATSMRSYSRSRGYILDATPVTTAFSDDSDTN